MGKRGGGLSGVHAVDLSAHVLAALAERSGIDPAVVDDVFWGCVSQVGEQTFNIGRNAVLAAGWPETVPGTTIDRQCGSSQQAVHFAAAGRDRRPGRRRRRRRRGVDEPGADGLRLGSTGRARRWAPAFLARYDGVRPNQGVGAEMIAERWGFSRTQLDEFALASHEKAATAQADGAFDGGDRAGDDARRRGGQRRRGHPARRHRWRSSAALKTPSRRTASSRAGNASQISDGAAALLVTTSEKAPRARADPAGAHAHRRCWPAPTR